MSYKELNAICNNNPETGACLALLTSGNEIKRNSALDNIISICYMYYLFSFIAVLLIFYFTGCNFYVAIVIFFILLMFSGFIEKLFNVRCSDLWKKKSEKTADSNT